MVYIMIWMKLEVSFCIGELDVCVENGIWLEYIGK